MPTKVVTKVFEETFNLITEEVMGNQKTVTLSKFGSFSSRVSASRVVADRFSKEAKAAGKDLKVTIPARMALGFSASPVQRLDLSEEQAATLLGGDNN